MAVTNVSATGATVDFVRPSAATSYTVVATPMGAGSALTRTSATSPVTFTGLLTNTTYQVAVQATCGSSASAPGTPLSFTTNCGSLPAYPYAEAFDGVSAPVMPCNYTVLDANADGHGWVNSASTTYASSGLNALRYSYNALGAADDWFFLPALAMQAGTSYQLQFKYRSFSSQLTSVKGPFPTAQKCSTGRLGRAELVRATKPHKRPRICILEIFSQLLD